VHERVVSCFLQKLVSEKCHLLLCQVLFQNDSLATLLARVVGILGPMDPAMLARGKDTHKYFTKANMLYERNQVCQHRDRLKQRSSSGGDYTSLTSVAWAS
jgi:hypothetical protein